MWAYRRYACERRIADPDIRAIRRVSLSTVRNRDEPDEKMLPFHDIIKRKKKRRTWNADAAGSLRRRQMETKTFGPSSSKSKKEEEVVPLLLPFLALACLFLVRASFFRMSLGTSSARPVSARTTIK